MGHDVEQPGVRRTQQKSLDFSDRGRNLEPEVRRFSGHLSLRQPLQRSADVRLHIEKLSQWVALQLPHPVRRVCYGERPDVQLGSYLRPLERHGNRGSGQRPRAEWDYDETAGTVLQVIEIHLALSPRDLTSQRSYLGELCGNESGQ